MLADVRFRLPLVLLALLVVHTTVMPSLRIVGVMPDVMLLLAVGAGLAGGAVYGAIIGFAAGMLTDLLLPTPLGLSALVFTVIGYAVGVTKGGLLRDTWWFPVVVTFMASSAGEGLFAVVGTVIGEPDLISPQLGTIMLVVGIFNGILAPLVLRLLRWALANQTPDRAYAE